MTVSPGPAPDQLRSLADMAEREELITVRVMPFKVGAHRGLGSFTLLQFDGDLADVLFIDAGRGEYTSQTIGDTKDLSYGHSAEPRFDTFLA